MADHSESEVSLWADKERTPEDVLGNVEVASTPAPSVEGNGTEELREMFRAGEVTELATYVVG